MVRAFAASAQFLRHQLRLSPTNFDERARNSVHDTLLDRVVPILVVVFLSISAISIFLQFTSTRNDALENSEDNLKVAAWYAASEISALIRNGQDASEAIRRLPREIMQPGRHFLIADSSGLARGGYSPLVENGRPAKSLLANPHDYTQLLKSTAMLRVSLSNAEFASITARALGDNTGTLIVYQPISEELHSWRKHAYAIGTILLCFGAITIAFSAAFYAQRARTRAAGLHARTMRNRFEIAMDRGHCALWDIALHTSSMVWSHSMYRLLGMAPQDDEMELSAMHDRLHPDDESPLSLIWRQMEEGKNEIDHLFRMQHENGHWVWLRMRALLIDGQAGKQSRLLGIAMDVTAERLAEIESHKADQRLRDAIESISEAFVLWDENNQLVLCNSKYQSFHGLPAHLVQRGTRYRSLMEQANEPQLMIEIDRGSDREARAYEAQFADGRWLLISERPTRVGGYVSVGTDITARKQQEERLIENERQLRMTISDLASSRETLKKQASQLAELADRYLEQKAEAISANRVKAEFLANMNHEIRTPLNHIIGFAEIIESEVFGPVGSDRYRGYAKDIRESGCGLLAIISDILDMARIEAGRVGLDKSDHAIGTLLAQTSAQVIDDAQSKSVCLDIEPDEQEKAGQRLIHVDSNAISQALVHLMRNAIRLSPVGGKVSMRARMQGDHVNIFIADSGCTLTASEMGVMRDPFGHIDGMLQDGCKGSGLGVAIARSLIELHGGTLRMRSSAQIGSLVMIHLPVAQEPVQLSLPMSALTQRPDLLN